ncbi:DNA/RNA non-specific endonuclease [Streptomyces sp. NPDC021093]|uniref:DNA/RNA non-specific endonuclease n=1 Tax=Streptomyces sp. NPDC021093 TaxID=3365112 RepID=UPI003793701D
MKHDKADAAGTLKSTTYAFDPLDRTTSKTEGGTKTEYNYLGMSSEVLTEEVATKLTASYQYSPWGERLSQVKHAADGKTDESYYGYNSHTDVETLTGNDGNAKATYGYTAYGSDDTTEFTGIDKPSTTNPTKDAYNPYRFNSKRWDAASGTYDMGFRDYSPGLNRFTSRDMYTGALSDMRLGSDPMAGNRYAFAAGNPVGNVEVDGHFIFMLAIPAGVSLGKLLVAATVATVAAAGAGAVAQDVADGTDDETSADEEPAQSPRTPRGTDTNRKRPCGWVDLGDRDAKNGNRATAMNACLTASSIQGGTSTTEKVRPPGYKWATRTAAHLRAFPIKQNINNCHLLGKQLGGSGTDLRNLATCSRSANAPQDGSRQGAGNMTTYENQIRDAVGGGEEVEYRVTPRYSGRRTVPTGFAMVANGTKPDGTPDIRINVFVSNSLKNRNLGMFNDPRTGRQIPTGGAE